MATVGEIAIVVGADVGPMVRELGKGKGALSDFGSSGNKMAGLLGTAMGKTALAVGAAVTALIALTKASMANIDAVSKQARAVGISVSSFQAMAMVAEEAGVESDKMSKILIKMQDNIASLANGTKAQVEQFGALGISMSDLVGLGADEQFALIAERIAAMGDPAQKTAAALNVFGKSGADAITMLDGYGAAVSDATKFQRDFGIAVTDEQAQGIEAANDAIGRLGMAFEGLGNTIAANVAPALENAANGLTDLIGAMLGAESTAVSFFQNLDNYKQIMEDFGSVETAAAMAGGWQELEAILAQSNAPELLEEMRRSYENLETVAVAASSAMASEINELIKVYPILGKAMGQMLAEVTRLQQALQAALDAGDIEAANRFRAELEVAVSNLKKAADGAQALGGVDMSKTVGWATALAGQLGVVAQAAMDAASAILSIPESGVSAPTSDDRSESIKEHRRGVHEATAWARDNPRKGSAGGGGGGGGADPMQQRLEALIESLKTESEIIALWYEESLAALNAASEAELEALGGKHEALERLEEEHQKRLLGTKEMGNQWSVDSVLQGGAEILTAMGAMNKKAMKAAGIVSAAQALISTYEGAAQELKAGTLGFPRAAAVIAKGIGFVAAIKSAASGGSSGGGGRGGGGSTAAAASAAPPVQRVMIDYNGPQQAMGSFQALVDMMNQAGKAGYVLNAQITGRS